MVPGEVKAHHSDYSRARSRSVGKGRRLLLLLMGGDGSWFEWCHEDEARGDLCAHKADVALISGV